MKKGDKIGKRTITAIKMEFPILWCGWECDSKAWAVVLDDGTKAIVSTDHGKVCLLDINTLNNKIIEYSKVSLITQKAIDFIL